MAAITILGDFGAPKNKICQLVDISLEKIGLQFSPMDGKFVYLTYFFCNSYVKALVPSIMVF